MAVPDHRENSRVERADGQIMNETIYLILSFAFRSSIIKIIIFIKEYGRISRDILEINILEIEIKLFN